MADVLLAANVGPRAPLWQVVVAGLVAAAIAAGTWVLIPPLFGVGRVEAVLWLSLVLLACVLWLARDRYSRVATAVVAGLILLVIRYGGAGTQSFFAHTRIWFLLIGGMRSVLDLSAIRAAGDDTTSDAYRLGRMAYLLAAIFIGFFAVVSFAAMVAGGLIMVRALGGSAS